MKKILCLLAFIALQMSAVAQSKSAERPKITGIDHVAFYTTSPEGVQKLYNQTLGLASADPIESGEPCATCLANNGLDTVLPPIPKRPIVWIT